MCIEVPLRVTSFFCGVRLFHLLLSLHIISDWLDGIKKNWAFLEAIRLWGPHHLLLNSLFFLSLKIVLSTLVVRCFAAGTWSGNKDWLGGLHPNSQHLYFQKCFTKLFLGIMQLDDFVYLSTKCQSVMFKVR